MGLINFNSGTKDKNTFRKIVNESVTLFGITVQYLTTTFDETKDKIYSDDTRPVIDGRYKMYAYTETIEEEWTLSRFGFNSEDVMTIHVGIKDFDEAVGAVPKEGDYVYINYMDRLFIVTDADKESNIFKEEKFVYNIHIKTADISGEEFADNLPGNITDYENVIDPQDDTDALTEAVSAIVVSVPGDQDIFGEWS